MAIINALILPLLKGHLAYLAKLLQLKKFSAYSMVISDEHDERWTTVYIILYRVSTVPSYHAYSVICILPVH